MKVSTFIARRYLFSRKEKTVINIISWISLIGITVSTLALIVVMSVYNGIGQLTQSLFNIFDPELLIEPAQGKTFHTSAIDYDALQNTPGVENISQIVEENAWITLRQAEAIVMTNTPLALHIPKRGTSSIGFSMDEAFNNGYAFPAGAFRIQEEIDNLYVVADIDLVRHLMSYAPDEVTALAVTLKDSKQMASVKRRLRTLLGDGYTVKDRFDQKPLYYKIFRSERLGVFLILSLIVLISTLNLIASLSLVFFTEGILIALVGVVAGLLLGFITCLLQQHFGIIKLGANAIVDAFPVAMRLIDFVATFLVVTLLSTLVVAFTVRRAKI